MAAAGNPADGCLNSNQGELSNCDPGWVTRTTVAIIIQLVFFFNLYQADRDKTFSDFSSRNPCRTAEVEINDWWGELQGCGGCFWKGILRDLWRDQKMVEVGQLQLNMTLKVGKLQRETQSFGEMWIVVPCLLRPHPSQWQVTHTHVS